MKAIIADIKNNKMVLICQNGEFHIVKAKKYLAIGQEIDFSPSSYQVFIKKPLVKFALIAASIFLVIRIGVWGYYIPNNYIDIDINPSVEIVTNHINKVIKVEALNEDGKNVLNNIKLENQSYDIAVGKIIEIACEKNYIKDNQDNSVMVTVTSNNISKNDYTKTVLKNKVEKITKEKNSPTEIEANLIPVSKYEEAKKQNLSPGKLLLLDRLKEVKPEANANDVKNERVKDILDNIKEKRKEKIEKLKENPPPEKNIIDNKDKPKIKPSQEKERSQKPNLAPSPVPKPNFNNDIERKITREKVRDKIINNEKNRPRKK